MRERAFGLGGWHYTLCGRVLRRRDTAPHDIMCIMTSVIIVVVVVGAVGRGL